MTFSLPRSFSYFSSFIVLLEFLSLLNTCNCFKPRNLNLSSSISITASGWSPAGATWYGSPSGAGSDGTVSFFPKEIDDIYDSMHTWMRYINFSTCMPSIYYVCRWCMRVWRCSGEASILIHDSSWKPFYLHVRQWMWCLLSGVTIKYSAGGTPN